MALTSLTDLNADILHWLVLRFQKEKADRPHLGAENRRLNGDKGSLSSLASIQDIGSR